VRTGGVQISTVDQNGYPIEKGGLRIFNELLWDLARKRNPLTWLQNPLVRVKDSHTAGL
jgi:hypothetical protein